MRCRVARAGVVRLGAVGSGLALLFAAGIGGVGGGVRAAGPSPAATATALPKASYLLDQMMHAWQAAGSDHFRMDEGTVWITKTRKLSGKDFQVGDVAWGNPPIFQMSGPTYAFKGKGTNRKVVYSHEIQLYAKNRLAIRLGSGKWSCNSFYGYSDLPGDPAWDGTSPNGFAGQNLGQTTVNGELAWHVRSVDIVPGPKKSSPPTFQETHNYYIAVDTYQPVEFRFYTESSRKGMTSKYHEVMTFSNFGEAVDVTLPPVCKT